MHLNIVAMSDTIIKYLDANEFYNISYAITLVFLLFLVWFFIRVNLTKNDVCTREMMTREDPAVLAHMPEFDGSYDVKPLQISDPALPRPYKLWGGVYGDVPIYIYDTKDVLYKPEFDHANAIYLPNWRTAWRR